MLDASNVLSFLFASFVSLFSVTYSLRLPYRLTNSTLVKEYYETNYVTNVPFDIFFIACYLIVAFQVASKLKMKTYLQRILIVGLTTAILTATFCYFFKSRPVTSSFFSRWFHTVGYTSVVYDVILLMTVFVVYSYMCEASSPRSSID